MSETVDKASLLDDLRLDRQPEEDRPKRRRWPLVLAIATIVLGGAALFIWLNHTGHDAQGIRIVTAESIRVPTALEATGYIVPRRQATISAKVLGKLALVAVEEGQHVEQGQIVARLDDANALAALAVARAQADQAAAALSQAEVVLSDVTPNFERYRNLSREGAVSAEAFERVKSSYDSARTGVEVAREALAVAKATATEATVNEEDTFIRAPFSGVVTDITAQAGEVVSPAAAGGGFTRTGIATIVDMNTLEAVVEVSESNIADVRAGQSATATLNAYPGWPIAATVIGRIPTADEAKGTVKVRVALSVHDDERILPQMGVRVSFLTGHDRAVGVVIPSDAVLSKGHEGKVFMVGADGQAHRRIVRIGSRTADGVVVLSGLGAGERVVAGDLSRMRDGMDLDAAK